MHSTLPRHFYTDPEFYRDELDRFYFQRWICAGRVDQIPEPGDFFVRTLGTDSVIITRDESGQVHGLFNVCRHRGTRLCDQQEGRFDQHIQCPYHAWTYDLGGRLLGAPHMETGFRREDYPLQRAHCDVWEGHIFLHMGRLGQIVVSRQSSVGSSCQPLAVSNVTPLGAHLADLTTRFANWRMGELRRHRRIVYDVKANWKLIVLNFNECLHCPTLHPALNRLHHYLGADNVAPTPIYCGGAMGFKEGVETMSLDGHRRRAYLPGLTTSQQRQVAYYSIYPNLLLSLHPDYMMTHTLWPRGYDRTEIVCEWHFHPDEMARPGFQADDAVSFWDITNREDWWIAEQSQAGISCRAYQPGPYSEREELLWSFDEIVRREAGGPAVD